MCLCVQSPPWAAGLVSLDLGTGALPLCALLLNGASWPNIPTFHTSFRFQAVPWGNFDLERMSDRSGCFPGPSHVTVPWPGLPRCLPAHWDTR